MSNRRPRYVWQQPDWPALGFDAAQAGPMLAHAHRMQGRLEGKAQAIGLQGDSPVAQALMAEEAMATAAIEGERLAPDAVRSSVLRRLGLGGTGPQDRHADGQVAVIDDATRGFAQPLDHDRLWRWQSALFPGGTSGIRRIEVGRYRSHADPMQIVSGRPGKEVVHYEAPPSSQVMAEMSAFLGWFNQAGQAAGQAPAMDGVARAALAHLWFETIHPFEDGNGRIGRAIVDMAIAQHHQAPVRLYGLSRQLLATRGGYYEALNAAQCGGTDVTAWVVWFAQQLALSCEQSGRVIDAVIEKARFWAAPAAAGLNQRQRKVVQRLLDDGDGGFLGGLNADKYIKLTATSKPTATRDLADLVASGLLFTHGQGKALRYYLNMPGWRHGLPAPGGAAAA